MTFQFDTNSNPTTGAICIFKLRTVLVNVGWSSVKDSDGTTFSSGGTQLTSGNSGANGLGNTNAWFVLKAPAASNSQQRSICFRRGSTNTVWRVKYSPSVGFTGGSPSATQVPSATDEIVVLGGGTDSSPSFSTLLGSDGTLRFNAVAGDTTVDYAWYFDAFPTGNAATTHYGIMFEVMKSGSFPSADTDPAAMYIIGGGNGSSSAYTVDLWESNSPHAILNNGGTPTWQVVKPFVYYDPSIGTFGAPAYISSYGFGTNSFTSKDDGIPMCWGRLASVSAPSGYKGFGQLTKYAGTLRANYDTISVATPTAKDFIWVGAVLLPWDGSTPTI